MDRKSDPGIALLSIRPQFARRILAGTKKVEFRRRPFKRKLEFVVVYATEPVKMVLGFFQVSQVTPAAPDVLWTEFAHVGGIDKKQFNDYYAGQDVGYAIEIGEVWKLRKPILLNELAPRLTPPQSFTYLASRLLSRLRRRTAPKARRASGKSSGARC